MLDYPRSTESQLKSEGTLGGLSSSVDFVHDINFNKANLFLREINRSKKSFIAEFLKDYRKKLKNMEFTLMHEINKCRNSKENYF